MTYKVLFPICFSVGLLSLAAIFNSPAFAYASVLSLCVSLFRDIVEQKVFAVKDIKLVVPDEYKKRLEDLQIRISAIEYDRANRGY